MKYVVPAVTDRVMEEPAVALPLIAQASLLHEISLLELLQVVRM
jgi:hypothetical protein